MIHTLSPALGTLHLRRSLKRGLARQAVALARKTQADHAAVFAEFQRLAPNRRAIERSVLRLRKLRGVVSAGISEGNIVVVLRNACALLTRANGMDAFQEEGLIYTRFMVVTTKTGLTTGIARANFSLHAMERFVERSGCGLGADYLPALDAEAAGLLRAAMRQASITHKDDSFFPAIAEGVWAGSMDLSAPEPEWRGDREDACVPTFSARTFLGPEEMSPEVWLHWKNDPGLTFTAA